MDRTFDITDFGAKSGLMSLQSKFIQAAIDACFKSGGGTVIIPEGIFYTGDIRLRTGVRLHLRKNAVLNGSQDPDDYFNYLSDAVEPLTHDQITDAPYVHLSTIHGETEYEENKAEYRFKRIPGSRWNNAMIRAIDARDISITGEEGSMIDGGNCFDETGEEHYRGPHGMTFFNCKNITLSGYSIKDTGNWAHNMLFCDNIDVKNIKVFGGHDGFDASVCSNLSITDSEFYTGDDCIAGFGNINTLVSNCILNSSCSAMRFGGSNVLVEKCKMIGPGEYFFRGSLTPEEKRAMVSTKGMGGRNNMLSAFTYYADYSLPIKAQPENIVISDCEIVNADRFLHYNYSGNETWQKNRPLKSIEFRNIRAVGISMPITAYGSPDVQIDLILDNVNLSLREGSEDIDLMHLCNHRNVILSDLTVKNHSGENAICTWSDGNILIYGTNLTVKKAETPFFCQKI